jgi:hypothetical protein
VRDQRRPRVDRLDDDGDAAGRNLRRLERRQHRRRQAVGQSRQRHNGQRHQREQTPHAASAG